MVNRTMPSLLGVPLEIKLTVPLKDPENCSAGSLQVYRLGIGYK